MSAFLGVGAVIAGATTTYDAMLPYARYRTEPNVNVIGTRTMDKFNLPKLSVGDKTPHSCGTENLDNPVVVTCMERWM